MTARSPRGGLVLALVAMLLVAGCSVGGPGTASPTDAGGTSGTSGTPTASATASPSPTPTASATPTDSPTPTGPNTVTVRGEPLPYDANRTFHRVQEMLGTDLEPPVVRSIDDVRGQGGHDRVAVSPDDSEAVLAHEYAHYILYETFGAYSHGDADTTWARTASAEGAAQYVQREYVRRYLDEEPGRLRLPADPGWAYEAAMYRFGADYYAARTDSPAEVTDVYPNPPNTSEQVLHAYAPGEEPPRSLRAGPADRNFDSGATWRYDGKTRLGEAGLFVTLRTRLRSTRAREVAAGWGNDHLLEFRSDDAVGYAWVVRWDDAANQTAFEAAVADFREADRHYSGTPTTSRRTPDDAFVHLAWGDSDASFDYRPVSDETGVLLVGPAVFVEAAEVSGGTDNVTVTVEG